MISALPVHADAADAAEPSKQMVEFFALEDHTQKSFISNNIYMIAIVAAQTAPKIAKCIDNWHGGSKNEAQSETLKVMRDYLQYEPQSIILAVVEKQCGKFKRALLN